MKFKATRSLRSSSRRLSNFSAQIDVREVGRVLEVGDGIAQVYGLSGVMAGEMVEFPSGAIGLAFNLEENSVGVIILGDYLKINEGDEVRSTGQLLSVPVGDDVARPRGRPAGQPARRQGADRHQQAPPGRGDRPRRRRAPAGERAAADRHQGRSTR